jgi:hypothetical protein
MIESRKRSEGDTHLKTATYLELLIKRRKETRVYKKHQALGLELSSILDDPGHIALYIKLAREEDPSELLKLAHLVKERANVKRKGAYFMRLLALERLNKKNKKP